MSETAATCPLTEDEAAMVAQAVKDLDPAAELDFGRRNASLLARHLWVYRKRVWMP